MTRPRATRGSRRRQRAYEATTRQALAAKAEKGGGEEGVPRRLLIRRGVAFAGAAFLPTWLALHGGGFDLVIRQQTSIAVWWVIAAGFAIGVLPRVRLDWSLLIPAIALGGLVGWTLLSLTWTESSERTWVELSRLIGYAGFAVIAWSALNRYTFRAAAGGLSVSAVAVCVLAVASRLVPSSFPVDEVQIAFNSDRLTYPFGYWNAVAAWGSMTFAICLCWSAQARHAAVRALALGAVPIAGTAIYLTYSRGGVLSAGVAVLAAIALSRNRWTAGVHAIAAGAGTGIMILVIRANPAIAEALGGKGGAVVAATLLVVAVACGGLAALTSATGIDRVRLEPQVARIALPVVLVSVLLIGGVAGHHAISKTWHEFLHDDVSTKQGTERLSTAGGDRNDLWGSAIDAFQADSFKGIGPGTFEFWWDRDGRVHSPVVNAHSLYFETLGELGAVGFLLLLVLIGGLIFAGVRGRNSARRTADLGASAAMLAGFIVFLFHASLDWLWQFPALVALGLGGAAIAAAATSVRLARSPSRVLRLRIGAAVAAFGLGAMQIPALVMTERSRDSERALADGDAVAARSLASDAIQAEPWAATPRAQRAFSEESLGDLRAARDDLEGAREREPTNWRWAAELARVDRQLGDRSAAADAQADAARLNRIGEQ
jgi:O-antigen ligase/polysaccharide polymerase Wzy-like membrane protein